MSENPELLTNFRKKRFSSRVNEIEKYVKERAFTKFWKNTALQKWNKTRKLSHLRNRVAHNPIMFSWSDPDGKGEPDLLGVIDMKRRARPKKNDEDLLSKLTIETALNEAADLAVDLESLRIEWMFHP